MENIKVENGKIILGNKSTVLTDCKAVYGRTPWFCLGGVLNMMIIKFNVDIELLLTEEDIKDMLEEGIDLNDEEEILRYFEDGGIDYTDICCECINEVDIDFEELQSCVKKLNQEELE